MRILKNTLASAALASLLAVQPVAAAAQAAPAIERTGTTLEDADSLRGGGAAPVLVVIGGFVVLLVLMDLLGAIDVFGDSTSP